MVVSAGRAVHLRADRTFRRRRRSRSATARCCCGSSPRGCAAATCPASAAPKGRLPGDTGTSAAEMDGFPIHEVVGEVIASSHRSHRHRRSCRRLGIGLRRADGVRRRRRRRPGALRPGADAASMRSALQPLACVLYAVEQLPKLERTPRRRASARARSDCCSPMSAKASGAAHVTGVDPIDRDAVGHAVRGRHRGARHQRPLGEPPATRTTSPTS